MATETSTLAAQADIAAAMAISLGPLLRSDDMVYADDSIVHLNMGDSGINESSFPNGYKMLRRHMYMVAKHFLSEDEINSAIDNPEKERDNYNKLKDMGVSLKFASHIYDNKIGISCSSDVSQSWQDPIYDYKWMEKDTGMLKIFRYDSLNFQQVLQESVKLMHEARLGPVMAHVNVLRVGGHSLSNYYGLGIIPETAKASPIPSLTLEEAMYNNNNDSVLNALKFMADLGYLDSGSAVKLLEDAQRTVIERFIGLIPKAKSELPKKSVVPRWAYDEEKSQNNWENLIINSDNRDKAWRTGHFDRLSKTPGIRFKPEENVRLPEDMDEVTPIQAENFSLADMMLLSGTFRAFGEDLMDIRPDLIDEVIKKPGYGTGGINKATTGLQALSHIRNPKTGRYHVLDIGIDEAGLYAIGAATSKALDGKGFVMCEMQFNDYDFGLFAQEEISSIYQRSNAKETLPVIIRQSYGFVRGRTIKSVFEKGGAAGVYHSACHIGNIASRYKGMAIVVPNTARAIQMAYRNAVSGQTPTVILMSNPAMRSIAIGSFPYTGKYLPLDMPLDPLGTYYPYAVKGDPKGAHHHIILTYGEYVPICHYIAEQLYEAGIKTLVVDYNYAVPRNEKAAEEILGEYRDSFIKPKFTVVSQEGDFGFGDVIINDLMKSGITADKISKKERINQWLAESLTFPTPESIYNHILSLHKDKITADREYVFQDVPKDMWPMAEYFAGF
jgi:pyruvate/2-oxoglutarate/acetoin dehydrogenase E1 component